MSASENQIVVYQPNETVRLDVRLQKCCQCDNVAIYQFPISSRGGGMIRQLETGNIGIGNTSTLATFNKCFGFTKMDAGEVERIKKAAFGVMVKS
jgi:hypothetical protein